MSPNTTPDITMRGAVYALLATLAWSGNFLIARAVVGHMPPITLSTLRWLMAILFMLPFCWQTCRRELPAFKKHWGYYLAASMTGAGLFNTLIYLAGLTTNVVNMALIAASAPIFTVILARLFLQEQLTSFKLVGIVAALSGVVLLAVRGDIEALLNLHFLPGDLLVLLAAVMFAVYSVMLRKKPAGMGLSAFIMTLFILSLISLLPFTIWELAQEDVHISWDKVSVGSVLYLALAPSIAGFWFWNKAVAAIGSGNAMLFYYTLPFFSALAAVWILDEPILWVHYVSGLLIICGLLLATRTR